MDIRDLIINETIATPEEKAKKARVKSEPKWDVVVGDNLDCAIRRTTPKTSRLLALVMSQGQFYIKNEKSGAVEKLTTQNFTAFFKGRTTRWDRYKLPVKWVSEIGSLEKAADFVAILKNEDFQWLARHGFYKYEYGRRWYPSDLASMRSQYDSPIPRLIRRSCEELLGRERVAEIERLRVADGLTTEAERKVFVALNQSDDTEQLKYFADKFSVDGARTYFNEFLITEYTGRTLPNLSYYGERMFRDNNFETKRFIEYLLHESIQQGYGVANTGGRYYYRSATLNDFITTWADTLNMQRQIRGRVYDKYPSELDSLHRKLSFKSRLMERTINEAEFARHSERLSELSKKDATYTIRPPFNREDLLDEAQQQSNCLASYVDAYIEDRTDLYFMRHTDEPEKSLVTIEVRDGAIRQAYRACNRTPSEEEAEWLNEWAKEHGITPIDVVTQRPLVA